MSEEPTDVVRTSFLGVALDPRSLFFSATLGLFVAAPTYVVGGRRRAILAWVGVAATVTLLGAAVQARKTAEFYDDHLVYDGQRVDYRDVAVVVPRGGDLDLLGARKRMTLSGLADVERAKQLLQERVPPVPARRVRDRTALGIVVAKLDDDRVFVSREELVDALGVDVPPANVDLEELRTVRNVDGPGDVTYGDVTGDAEPTQNTRG